MKQIRHGLGEALGLGRSLSMAEMSKLCGLAPANGADTYRKCEDGDGPSGPVAVLLSLYADGVYDEDVAWFFRQYIRERLDR